MKKSEIITQRRKDLIIKAINEPQQACDLLRKKIDTLEKSQGTTERIRIMADLLHLSEATVFKDLAR
jgi:hypothetical protein